VSITSPSILRSTNPAWRFVFVRVSIKSSPQSTKNLPASTTCCEWNRNTPLLGRRPIKFRNFEVSFNALRASCRYGLGLVHCVKQRPPLGPCVLCFWADAHRYPPHPGPLPQERGNHSAVPEKLNAVGLQPRRNALLPLPKGEGWGEGEGNVRSLHRARN
jgi:hypothetical protein